MILALCVGMALAIEPDQPISVTLAAGGELQGSILSWDETTLRLLTPDGVMELPLALVAQAEQGGRVMDAAQLRAELVLQTESNAPRIPPELGPAPPLVALASMTWAGAGQALQHDRGEAIGYAVVDGLLLGGAAYMLLRERNAFAAIPFVGLDLVLRVYSAAEAVDEARRRRSHDRL